VGWGKKSVNALLVQRFINYNFPHGWYITTSPINVQLLLRQCGDARPGWRRLAVPLSAPISFPEMKTKGYFFDPFKQSVYQDIQDRSHIEANSVIAG